MLNSQVILKNLWWFKLYFNKTIPLEFWLNTLKYKPTLNAMCSRKWATPLFSSVSNREPASIHSPMVAVGAPVSSVATLKPLSKVVVLVGGKLTSTSFNWADVLAHLSGNCKQEIEYGRHFNWFHGVLKGSSWSQFYTSYRPTNPFSLYWITLNWTQDSKTFTVPKGHV